MTESKIPGPGVDLRGTPVDDPTFNVLQLVDAAVKRLDDLRDVESRHVREIMSLRDEATKERQRFNEALRTAETARIDAIRTVDVNAVARAAEVSAQLASTLALQVQTTAETMRTQVSETARATSSALSTALEPITKRLEELSRIQYEQQGQKAQAVESKGTNQWVIGLIISIMFLGMAIIGFAYSIATKN